MVERESDLSFATEVWEKLENKKHQIRLEELFEVKGIKYISTPRPGAKRGGGSAIAARLDRFTLSKLNISLPKGVEAVWGLLRPKFVTGMISVIIVCCFYSPPRSRKNTVMIDHLTVTLQSLLKTYPDAGVIISGDRNSMEISSLLSIDPTLRQIVTQPTRGRNILDVIITNLARYYQEPAIVPPLAPDKPGHGVPSDHSGVYVVPISGHGSRANRNIIRKVIRPLPASLIEVFKTKLASQDFESLKHLQIDHMVEAYQNKMNTLLSEIFPLKTITISDQDKPWFNEQLRQIKRQRLREYEKHGLSNKYWSIVDSFEKLFKTERAKYFEKIRDEVTNGERGSIYPILKRLSHRPGDPPLSGFLLPDHAQLSHTQAAEIIATHFSSISQEYTPLDVSCLPPNIRAWLTLSEQTLLPRLSVRDVEKKISKAKKPNGLVEGDLPKKLVQVCSSILAYPASIIFNNITQTAQYPSNWKVEHQVALPKVSCPETLDDLRNIAKTQFLSKVYESFIGEWLIPIIKPYLDPDQCGLKGFSITDYLIKLLHFVHTTLDLRQPHAVLAACIDLSKAFNRVDHALVIQDLYDMHTPPWLLRIVISYLTGRSMILTYNGEKSSQKMLPGGGPQGAYLGGLIFIIKYNGALLRPSVPRHIEGPVSKSESVKAKFVDDGTVAVSVNLKSTLIPDPVERPQPWNYAERTGHILPVEQNLLHYYIREAENYSEQNKMMINKQKTKVIKFSKSRNWDFPPELSFADGTHIECVSAVKLVGVVVSQDLKWDQNTAYICKKARSKLWILRRMKNMELDVFQLFDVYIKEVRSILEMAVPVWHSSLTKKQTADIERIQKVAFRLILESQYRSYQSACDKFKTETLHNRRIKLCLKYARKNLKSDHSFFDAVDSKVDTRQKSKIGNEYKCNSNRFSKSSIQYMAKLLNYNSKQ